MKLRDLLALAVIALVAVAYTVGVVWPVAHARRAIPNYDTYALYYPNLLYAIDSLRLGEGVLWNRFQNCGQPFFAIAATGILYPPHAIYLLFAPHTGLFVLTAVHLLLAGVFAYALFRQIDLDFSAALAGAFAFQLGGITLFLNFWSPTLVGHYLWIPAAMAACERILRQPSVAAGLLLGLVLSVQFLAGYPPITFFTYQLLGLRVLWEIAGGERSGMLRKGAAVALGLALPVGLIAVQLYPSLEFAGESLRNRVLTPQEIRPPALNITWKSFRGAMGERTAYGGIVAGVPLALAAVGLTLRSTRRQALFYLLIAASYGVLSFDNPLSALYQQLPLGKSFRMPHRFLWLVAFALAALTALGAQAATAAAPRRRLRIVAVLAATLGGAALVAFVPLYGFGRPEWELAAATIAIAAAAAWRGRGNVLLRLALPALVLFNQLTSTHQLYGYLPGDSSFFDFRDAFAAVRERLTPQERIYHYSAPRHYGLQRKSPSLFRLPSITDYESQTSERFAELYVRMIRDAPMRSVNDFYYQVAEIPKNRPLFDLLAARYLLLHTKGSFFWPEQMRDLKLLRRIGAVSLLENDRALPRAYFVPRVEVVADRAALLERLASPSHDPRALALVEEPLPGGGGGSDAPKGDVTILEDRSEELLVRVRATGPGFLFLADQLYPGWEATVNGAPAPMARANYAFRLVRVPGGESSVVFRYQPFSLWLGKWVSAATIALLVAFLALRFVRGRRSPLPHPESHGIHASR